MSGHRRRERHLGDTEFVEVGIKQVAEQVCVNASVVEHGAQVDDAVEQRCATVEQRSAETVFHLGLQTHVREVVARIMEVADPYTCIHSGAWREKVEACAVGCQFAAERMQTAARHEVLQGQSVRRQIGTVCHRTHVERASASHRTATLRSHKLRSILRSVHLAVAFQRYAVGYSHRHVLVQTQCWLQETDVVGACVEVDVGCEAVDVGEVARLSVRLYVECGGEFSRYIANLKALHVAVDVGMKGEWLFGQSQHKLQGHHSERQQHVRLAYGCVHLQSHHAWVSVGEGREVHVGTRFEPRHGRSETEVGQRYVRRVEPHVSLCVGHAQSALLAEGAVVESELQLGGFLLEAERVDAQRNAFQHNVINVEPFLSHGEVVVVADEAVTPVERAYLVYARTEIDVAVGSRRIGQSDAYGECVAGHVYLYSRTLHSQSAESYLPFVFCFGRVLRHGVAERYVEVGVCEEHRSERHLLLLKRHAARLHLQSSYAALHTC